jgi:hypothetical protein
MLNVRLPKLRKPGIVQGEKGFTILEVLIAIFVTVVIGTAIALAIGTSSKVLVSANTKEVAKDIAASDMEYIKSLPWADNYILLTSSSSSSSYGNPVIFKAIVSPGPAAGIPGATGTVTFKDGGTALPGSSTVTLSGGQAIFSTSTLTQGSHNIKAVYSGDATHSSLTSIVLTQTVTASSTTSTPAPAINSNYLSSINITSLRMNEQQIDITITWGGKTVFTLTDYRVNY